MKLHQAFEVMRGDIVAFIGAGGKTATLVGLGYELVEEGWRVIATAAFPVDESQLDLFPSALQADVGNEVISAALSKYQFVFLFDHIHDGKVYGLRPSAITALLDEIDSDVLLIEADRADGLPLKAPLPGEPAVPLEASLVVPVVSLSVLGETMDDSRIYNARAMMERYGFAAGSRVKSAWVAQVLRDETLGMHGVPSSARVVAFLNQLPQKGYGRGRARLIARLVLRSKRLSAVAIGSVRGAETIYEVQRPVGAVVLAAGLSSRMGQMKVLLPWGRKTILEHIIEQLQNARVDHITVVTGHQAREVREVVAPLGVEVVFNRSYKTGEMLSSLKVGLQALPAHIAAVLVVLGDQPRIQPKTIYQVMMAYAEGRGEIVAPSFERRRGHPILIARRYWPEILELPADGVLRDVINAHNDRIAYVVVDNDSVLHDIDTPADYSGERNRAGLGDDPG